MVRSQRNWQETWYAKLLIVALGAAFVYAARIEYVSASARGRLGGLSGRQKQLPELEYIDRVDFAGKSLAERRRLVSEALPGQRDSIGDIIGSLRGAVYVRVSRPDEDNPPTEDAPLRGQGESLSYQLRSASAPPLPLYPTSTGVENIELLIFGNTSPHGLDEPKICLMDGDEVAEQMDIQGFRPLPTASLGEISKTAPLTLTKLSREADSTYLAEFVRPSLAPTLRRERPAQYVLRLQQPVPVGERAYARLVRTEFGIEEEDADWHALRDGQTTFFSPIGPLAGEAELELVYCRPTILQEDLTEPLGQIAVRFGQPTFCSDRRRMLPLTPSLAIELPQQGNPPKRPSKHPKRAILISASLKASPSPGQIPDSIARIRWISPSPAALGLDAIWFPWGSVYAPSPSAGPLSDGPLTAKLHVSYVRWGVTMRQKLIVPIRDPSP